MYEAEGLLFDKEEEAAQARNEAEGIRYLKEKTSMDNPDMVLKLYNNLLDKKLFRTEVGLRFLFELQEYLVSIPYIKSEDIKPIPTRKVAFGEEDVKRPAPKAKPKKTVNEKQLRKWKRRSGILGFICIVLFASVIGMFVVAFTTGDAQERIDFENSVIDKYSSWEQELQEKEQKLLERESELDNNSQE